MTTPIIIFSDAASAQSGLARITRDLATRISNHLGNDFRIATLGYGSPGSVQLPFMQYHWSQRDDFLPVELPRIWDDFCGSDPGILMTIGDIQRFLPLADPKFAQDRPFGEWMAQMRLTGLLKLWGYFPIDAHSRGGGLGPQLGHTLSHYDRRLVPSEWAREIVRRTLPDLQCDVLPHGIDCEVFKPYPKEESRDKIGLLLVPNLQWPQNEINIPEEALWVGIVATNQSRKDWGLGIEVVTELAKSRPVMLWIHTNLIKSEWSLLELLSDFGLLGCSMLTTGTLSDEVMAQCYSACDVTLGIGRGEGFGYPIAESWACGVPCVAGGYGAHAEYFPNGCAVHPLKLRLEGPLNLLRPLFDAEDWIGPINDAEGNSMVLGVDLDWQYLWPRFSNWFKKGIE